MYTLFLRSSKKHRGENHDAEYFLKTGLTDARRKLINQLFLALQQINFQSLHSIRIPPNRLYSHIYLKIFNITILIAQTHDLAVTI